MNTVYIACCQEGIPIRYNGNERNIETVFLLTKDGEIIQNMTYRCPILPEPEKWIAWKDICYQNQSTEIEEGFLFYTFQYQTSFAHYLTQTLPLLVDFLQHASRTTKLLIPSHTQTTLQTELLSLLQIPKERIEILLPNQLYKIQQLYKRKMYETPPSPFTPDHIWILQEVRKGLHFSRKANERRVYIKRDGRSNPSANNSESGVLRQIKNESELIHMLQSEFDFEVVTLGDKSLQEKVESLAGIRCCITPLGANCMNFSFVDPPSQILLLSNEKPIGHDYYVPLASAVNQVEIPFTLLTYPILEHSDPTNPTNGSFAVNLDEIRNVLKMSL